MYNLKTLYLVGLEKSCRLAVLPILLAVAFLSAAGCSDSGGYVAPPKNPNELPEVAQVRAAFASADNSLRFVADDIVRLANAGAYGEALPILNRLAENPKLSADQKQAL